MWAQVAQAIFGSAVANAILGIPEANAPGYGDVIDGVPQGMVTNPDGHSDQSGHDDNGHGSGHSWGSGHSGDSGHSRDWGQSRASGGGE